MAQIRAELNYMFLSKALLKVDDLERFLEVEPDYTKKARILCKGAAKKASSKIEETIVRSMKRFILQRGEGATFSINGKEYTFEGEEAEEPQMKISLDVLHERGRWTVRMPRRSSSGSIGRGNLPFLIEKEKGWKSCFTDVTDERWKEYELSVQQRGESHVKDAVLSTLAVELRLNQEQREKLDTWLDAKIKYKDGQGLVENVKRTVGQSDLFDSVPEFLSELQQKKWSSMKRNPHPLGW